MARRSLFVGNLPYDLSNDEFRAAFERFGPIKSVNIARQGRGWSRGYGFVDFESDAGLDNALAHPNEITLEGRHLNYREAQERAQGLELQAAVLQIPNSVTNDQLLAHFAGTGCTEGKIVHRGRDGMPGFGYVAFATKAQRDAAIQAKDRTSLGGGIIEVKEARRPFTEERD